MSEFQTSEADKSVLDYIRLVRGEHSPYPALEMGAHGPGGNGWTSVSTINEIPKKLWQNLAAGKPGTKVSVSYETILQIEGDGKLCLLHRQWPIPADSAAKLQDPSSDAPAGFGLPLFAEGQWWLFPEVEVQWRFPEAPSDLVAERWLVYRPVSTAEALHRLGMSIDGCWWPEGAAQ
jgi:hypothetical protein